MDYVAGEELSAAVETVLEISGVQRRSGGDTGKFGETETPGGAEEAPPPCDGGRRQDPGDTPAEPGASPERRTLPEPGSSSEPRPSPELGASPESGGGGSAAPSGEKRLESVQRFLEPVPEIRHEFVRSGRGGTAPALAAGAAQRSEIRPEIVRRDGGPADIETSRPNSVGQVSRETGTPPPIFRRETRTEKKTQALVEGLENRTQNVAKATAPPMVSRAGTGGDEVEAFRTGHEMKSEFWEGPHETKSEIPGDGSARMHEIGSEIPPGPHETESEILPEPHETESEILMGGSERLHEIKSDIPSGLHETKSGFREIPHEIKSEIPGDGGRAAHETKSEILPGPHETMSEFREMPHETKSESEGWEAAKAVEPEELARLAAERLLEGLRRAAGAR